MIAATLSSLCAPAISAKPEPLDAEFLDYLAACESKDDNWTVIAGDKQRRKAEKAPKKPAPAADKPAPEVKP